MPTPADPVTSGPTDVAALPRLEALARRVRRRATAARIGRRLALVAAQAGLLYLALVLFERLANVGRPVSGPVASFAAVVGAIVAATTAVASAPRRQEVARRLDRILGTRQLFSTAREAATSRAASPYERAMRRMLIERAEARAAGVDVRLVAPLRPRLRDLLPLATALAAVGGAVVLDALPPLPSVPTDAVVVEAPVPVAPERRESTAEELERLALAVEAEAERRRDPYLGALAEATRELSDRIRSGEATTDVAGRDLASLLDHLGDALGPSVRPEPAAERAGGVPPSAEGAPTASSGASSALDDAVDLARAFGDALERSQASRSPSLAASLYLDSAGMAEALREERSLGAAPGEAGGAPAGAAQNSTDAPGDAAGEGSHALTGEGEEAAAAFASRDDMALPEAAAGAEGARVGALGESDPDDAGTVFAGGGGGAAGDGGSAGATTRTETASPARRESGAWRHAALDPSARRLAGRLFAPATAEAGP